MSLQLAHEGDLPQVAGLMNAAFRGAAGPQNWSVEGSYITGERTNEALLREEIADGALLLLAYDPVTSALQGCVSLQALTPDRWYLGSLTVNSARQNTGFGRVLLGQAEQYAAEHGARTIEMTVIHVRDTLIAWYQRRGYRLTGETRPFPYGDNRYGTPTRDDLKFVVLERCLNE